MIHLRYLAKKLQIRLHSKGMVIQVRNVTDQQKDRGLLATGDDIHMP